MDANCLYYKVTNATENHHGYQYKEGENILPDTFNADPNVTCGPGGFYFTKLEFIHHFLDFGVNIREVFLPKDCNMVQDCSGIKWRADKINLGRKFSLFDPQTYVMLNIQINEKVAMFAFKHQANGLRNFIHEAFLAGISGMDWYPRFYQCYQHDFYLSMAIKYINFNTIIKFNEKF